MRLYGLRGFTHGGARTLSVMCDAGGSRERETLGTPPGLMAQQHRGRLSLYLEQRSGAIDTLVRRHRIEILDKSAWDLRKTALGERVYR